MQQDDQDFDPADVLRSLGLDSDIDKTSFTEAMQKAMGKANENFVDGTCHRQWCQDMDECLWVSLREFQNNMNDKFFEGNLAPEDFFISDDNFIRYSTDGCNLPEEFYEGGTLENKSISFTFELLQALNFVNNFADDFEVLEGKYERFNNFGQNLYRFLQYSLFEKDLEKRAEVKGYIKDFISENDLFENQDKEDFLLVIENL